MPAVNIRNYIQLQNDVSKIRNICILAHVDHGKTTLADTLIATNGIISEKMAGLLRYMDNRIDEQERGITMKSSCISLYYAESLQEYIINLIDSPGHVDFSSEVSTAIRICDGAILVVDVVEGVCSQTRSCLQQIHHEKLKPVLVLNKIDRLILEKKMSPLDAYIQMSQILEQVNAVVGGVFASDVIAKEDVTTMNDCISGLEESDDSDLYFCPKKGNVVFSSAVDGWAFSISTFAKIYAEKIKHPKNYLQNVLWGDFYYDRKKNVFKEGAQNNAKVPAFASLILEQLWFLYETIVVRKEKEKLPELALKIGVAVPSRDLRQSEPKALIKSLLWRWLPVDKAILNMVVSNIPGPASIDDERAEHLICPANCDFSSYSQETQALKEDFKRCDPTSKNVIAFITKMFPVEKANIQKAHYKPLSLEEIEARRNKLKSNAKLNNEQSSNIKDVKLITEDTCKLSLSQGQKNTQIEKIETKNDDQVFIGFARIFSGTLRKGMKIFVLSPKHDPRREKFIESVHVKEVEVGNLYLLMGGELQLLEEAPAGCVVGIDGLENIVIKTATLSTNTNCPSFELNMIATPILSVAVEPVNSTEMPELIKGLKLLNLADPCVKVSLYETGEHVIATLGEVHLQKCVADLEQHYAKIKLNVSKPIVSFRETIVEEGGDDLLLTKAIQAFNEKQFEEKIITIQTPNKMATISLLAVPLPKQTVCLLEKYCNIIKIISNINKSEKLSEKSQKALKDLKQLLTKSLNDRADLVRKIWSMGSSKTGSNILFNGCDYEHEDFWTDRLKSDDEKINRINDLRRDFNSSFVNGFQIAVAAGPLCEEPMHGIAFIVLAWDIQSMDADMSYGPFSGQIMSVVKEGCRRAFQKNNQRLVTPMYSCNVVTTAEVLGKMYAVIGRRHGKVVSSDMTHGSGNFTVKAVLPVIESFNFAQEIRKQTSGLACPQLVFSHWEIIPIDPFWVPTTDEEYEHFGEKSDTVNRAKSYIDEVRQRKGLLVEKKIVEHAEKQRTLSKNK